MEWYELRLNMCHRKVNGLIPFEKEFRALVRNLKFKKVKKKFPGKASARYKND